MLPSLIEVKLSDNSFSDFPDALVNCDLWRKLMINHKTKIMKVTMNGRLYKISIGNNGY